MSNNQITPLQIDWNGIVNAISTMMVMAFMVGIFGLMGKQLIAEHHSAHRCARCGEYKEDVKYRPGTGLWLCDDCFKLWSAAEPKWKQWSRAKSAPVKAEQLVHRIVEHEVITGIRVTPERVVDLAEGIGWEISLDDARELLALREHHSLGDESGLTERISAGTDVR